MNRFFIGLVALALSAGAVLAQSYPPPQVQSIGPNDLFQDVVGGTNQAQSYYAPSALFGNYSATLAGNNLDNVLIGGDPENLFQRGTTGSSVTTTVTYGGPDRWAYWSGASTAMTVSQDSTAADLPSNMKFGFKMARTSGQTGVVQMCMAQEVESLNSYGFRGATAELDFYAAAGANFSAASSNVTVYVITGSGNDEGMQKLAWGLNAGGGGSTAWTTQVNTGVTFAISTTPTRYTVAFPTPSNTTEVGVALCYTPVGTAGTNDYVAWSDIQLGRNSALATAAGTAGAVLPVGDTRSRSIARRPMGLETSLQQRYYFQINEPAANKAVGTGNYQTSTICDVVINLPVTMRVAPTLTIGGTAESNTTWAIMVASVTPVVLATTYLIQDAVIGNTVNAIAVQGTTAGKTAGQGCTLVGAGGGANIQASAEL